MSWRRVLNSAQALAAHTFLLCFTLFLVLKLDHNLSSSWWLVFLPKTLSIQRRLLLLLLLLSFGDEGLAPYAMRFVYLFCVNHYGFAFDDYLTQNWHG